MRDSLPSLAPHALLVFLLQIALLLSVALALGRLAMRLGLPALVGELLTGVLLGPSLLGAFAPGLLSFVLPSDAVQLHLLDAVGQLGVLLLVGITGVQLDAAMLRRRGLTGVKVSLSGLLLPLALGIGAGLLVPAALLTDGTSRWVFALFIGVAMCVTAIPVIAKILADMGLLHRDLGQLTLAAGAVDDAVGWFLLSIVAAAATTGVSGGQVALHIAYLVLFLVAALVVGRPIVRWAMRLAGRAGDGGARLTLAVVLIMLGAAATQAMGMEALFGAFVVGILIGQARAAEMPDPRPGRSLWRDLTPLRTIVLSVLAPLFLATAGLRMDLTALADPRVLLAAVALLAVAVAGKFAGAYLGARGSRLGHWEAIALGAGMNARGVVGVVVAATGVRLGVLSVAMYTVVVLIAVVTSVMGPPILRWAMSRIATTEAEAERELAFAVRPA